MKKFPLPKIDWSKTGGLVPAIVQDADTLQVLMLGYMNAAALKQTLRTKRVTFFSRSRQRLWVKGESSKNFLHLVGVKVDCDNDTLLVTARPDGQGQASGRLSFHEAIDRIEFPVNLVKTGGDYTLTGETTIDYRNWNLKVIRKALLFTVKPEVKIRFKLTATVVAEPAK